MTKWPQFITKDLGDTKADADEMQRRWEVYDREMQAIIAKGGVHQDDDGWWIDDATGELIGPDPEIERPSSDADLAKARPFKEALPELYESIQRSRGRPRVEKPKEAVTLRLDPDTLAFFQKGGGNWRAAMSAILDKATGQSLLGRKKRFAAMSARKATIRKRKAG